MDSRDRRRGCLLGLAIGDALGAAVEFKPPGTFTPVTTYRGDGPHGLHPGEWTDDTSMALALADSITHSGWDLNDQAGRYLAWRNAGTYSVNGTCFDIGMTTNAALKKFADNGDALNSGDRSERASGNGSIMRLAPVPICYAGWLETDLERLSRYAAESSITTHASPQCLSACRYFALVLAGLINGVSRDDVLAPDWHPLRELRQIEPLHSEVEAVANGSFRNLIPPAIQGSGYVVKSLEAALWAVHDARDFREAVLRAVNLGDDADTTGAVCGQLAGACWGESGIPGDWITGLARQDMLEAALDGLSTMVA
ncbi:MAG: ADP-ribosylglycohydrolase family protein [Planctomycetaceae bacterium]